MQEDLELIRANELMTLIILPVDDDQTVEQVRFDWTVTEFTETRMVIQLEFDEPYEISVYEEINFISLKINHYDLFVRQKDGWSVSYSERVSKELPKISDKDIAETVEEIGVVIGNAGKGTILIIFILRMIGSHKVNELLG